MLALTKENYHTRENTAVTNSKVKDFLLSKAYYKARHIDRTIVDEPTPSMLLGSAVDLIVTGSWDEFHKKFVKKEKGVEDDGRTMLTPAVFDKATAIAQTVLTSAFFAEYKGKTVFPQTPLQAVIAGSDVAGMPDMVAVDGGTFYIDDLKVVRSSSISSPVAWYWNCARMGYFRQLAVYSWLLKKTYGRRVKKIVCRHIAVSSSESAGTYPIKLFVIPPKLLKAELVAFQKTVKEIAKTKEFIDPPLNWSAAVKLDRPQTEFVIDSMDDE